jgi:hypothetical protein
MSRFRMLSPFIDVINSVGDNNFILIEDDPNLLSE